MQLACHSRTRQEEDITESSNACHGYFVTSAQFSTELSTYNVDNSFVCDLVHLFRCVHNSARQVVHRFYEQHPSKKLSTYNGDNLSTLSTALLRQLVIHTFCGQVVHTFHNITKVSKLSTKNGDNLSTLSTTERALHFSMGNFSRTESSNL